MPGITSNVASIITRMNRRKAAVTRELSAAARVLALEIGAESKRVMQTEIYNVPEKRTKAGKKAWRRTGNLKRAESARAEGVVIILRNNARYAAARYTLGTSANKREVRPPQRSVQWQEEAIARRRARILQVRREHVMRALTRP